MKLILAFLKLNKNPINLLTKSESISPIKKLARVETRAVYQN